MKLSGTKSPLSLSIRRGVLMFFEIFSCSMEFSHVLWGFLMFYGIFSCSVGLFHVLWGFLMFYEIFLSFYGIGIVSCSFEV